MPAAPLRPAAAPAAPQIAPAVAHLLSPSQVSTWLDCSARWYYKHALRLPDLRTAALALGEVLHSITAASLRIARRAKWSDDSAAQGEQLLAGMLAADLAEIGEPEPAELVRTARDMFAVWVRDIMPHLLTAREIEQRMEGTIAGVPVQGTADVITAADLVIDLKTASKKPSGVRQEHRLQLTTYAMLAEQATGRSFSRARLYTLTKTRTPAAIQQTVEITPADRQYAMWAYSTAQAAMQSGEAIIPRRSSLLCSRANCAYADTCEKEFGGCVRD
jgi:CRISPR/Cas system-associated exonuclease Cas4 (RecB family)